MAFASRRKLATLALRPQSPGGEAAGPPGQGIPQGRGRPGIPGERWEIVPRMPVSYRPRMRGSEERRESPPTGSQKLPRKYELVSEALPVGLAGRPALAELGTVGDKGWGPPPKFS